jgi:DNA-binding HxlR family transcriptional regulator
MRKSNSTNALNERAILDHCGMAYALSLIGGRWKPNILWALVRNGKVRYSHFKKVIPEISDRILALQLRELEADKLIRRAVYAEVPPRVKYELTDLGKSMETMLENIANWGEFHKKTVKGS